jgi:hypothetical protein
MAITNYDGIINSRAGGRGDDVFCQKASVGFVTGGWHCYIKAGGFPTSAVVAAATAGGQIMTATSVGAIPFKQATAGDSKYLLTFAAGNFAGPEAGIIGLIDILWMGGSIQTNSSATQAINSPALTRSTAGTRNQLGVMYSTTIGATASTMTIWYTDAGGTATSITAVLATAGVQGRMLPAGYLSVPLPNGIKSIQSCQVQTAQGAGGVDLMIFKALDFVPGVNQYTWVERDMTAQIDGILQLDQDASNYVGCITPVVLAAGSTGRALTCMVRTCAG